MSSSQGVTVLVIRCVTALLVLCSGVAVAATGPTIPAWVHPGLQIVYNGLSASKVNGTYAQPIRVVIVSRVHAVTPNGVAAESLVETPGGPAGGEILWSCNAAGTCRSNREGFNGKFWVDPAHPVDSVAGPNGEQYAIVGRGPYRLGGKVWNATTMSYQNAATGWKSMIVFETKTGLVLAYSEANPSEEVHEYFGGMR